MDIGGFFKHVMAFVNFDELKKEVKKYIETTNKRLDKLEKGFDGYINMKNIMNRLNVSEAEALHKMKIQEVYDKLKAVLRKLPENERHIDSIMKFQTKYIFEYYSTIEDFHLRAGTNPVLLEHVLEAIKQPILETKKAFGDSWFKLFTTYEGEDRIEVLGKNLDEMSNFLFENWKREFNDRVEAVRNI